MRTTTTVGLRLGRAALALVVLGALAGCGGEDEPGIDPIPSPTAAATAEPSPTPSPTPPAPADDEPTEAPASDVTTGSQVAPVVVDVDFEERVSDGTTMRVSRVEVTEQAVLVDVDLLVSSERAFVVLNSQFDRAEMIDDQGSSYALIPPADNVGLQVDGGQRLQGTLSFQGPLNRGAQTVQFIFNGDSDPDQQDQNDRLRPHFTFPPVDIAAG